MKKIILIIFVIFIAKNLQSQGCSDAGMCSAPVFEEERSRFNISLNNSFEMAEHEIMILSTNIGIESNFYDQWTISANIPYKYISGEFKETGNDVNINGIGDLSIFLTNMLLELGDFNLKGTVGAKLPTGDDDLDDDMGNALPMAFQTSLGTYDMILMLTLLNNDWSFTAGYQHPFNENDNNYQGYYAEEDELRKYPSSQNLDRGADLMLRAKRAFKLNDKLIISAGIMPIFRLQESTSDFAMINGEPGTIQSSDGLTLNIISSLNYNPTEKFSIDINAGFPVVNRQNAADGLKRAFAANLILGYNL